ncbi:hypothetical protein [Sinomonas flava]
MSYRRREWALRNEHRINVLSGVLVVAAALAVAAFILLNLNR